MPGSIPASATSEGTVRLVSLASVGRARRRRAWRRTATTLGVGITTALIAVAVFAGRIAPGDPLSAAGSPLSPPSPSHPMGTDDLGRDVWACVAHGARTSLIVASGVTVLALLLGLVVGGVSGWRGSIVDDLLMRGTELVQVVPRFFLAVVVIALFGASLAHVCLVLGLTWWPGLARIVRLDTLSYRERGHVAAAITLGASHLTIVRDHILPFVQQPILSVAAPIVTSAILTEAGLSYLGLADPNWISWGKLIQNGQTFVNHGWWLAVFPGIALVLTCVGVAFVLGAADRD